MNVPTYKLANNVQIPVLGIGMDQVKDFKQGYEALLHAFSIGYRSVDTAFSYGNEEMVGNAVRDSGLPRNQFFVTTKLTGSDHGYDAALRGFEKSIKRFRLEYLDSFLIHWPGKYLFVDTWKAFERLYREKRVRAIGVCNFNIHHLVTLLKEAEIVPMVNQIEWHPYFSQPDIARYCREHNILVEAWSPLMCGGEVLDDKVIHGIADALHKSPAQIILRWHLQAGRRIFPKSVTSNRIEENMGIFDFQLAPEQAARIDSLGWRRLRIGPNPDVFFENF